MQHHISLYCKNTGQYIDVHGGITLQEVADTLHLPFTPLCALVNNRTEPLCYPVYGPKQIEFPDPVHPASRRVYTHTLCMLLYKAVHTLYPGATLRIEHSVSGGYYCRLLDKEASLPTVGEDTSLLTPDVEAIRTLMHRLVADDLPITRHERLTSEVIAIFKTQGLHAKVQLLETLHDLYTTYYTLDGVADTYYSPLAPRTSLTPVFELLHYDRGMLLLPPGLDMHTPATPVQQRKMLGVFTDSLRFNHIVGVRTVGQLNTAVDQGRSPMLINVAETLHSARLADIAADIAARRSRIVLLAGPSSSGKTTTCKRLAVHLMTHLLDPCTISLDDYFVNRADTPRDPLNGDYDYEHLHALDLDLLGRHIHTLLCGGEVNLPTYSFEKGERTGKHRPLRLLPHQVLLIEGIHGLNPALLPAVPTHDIYKVYVSALTTLHIDDHNWIPTTDSRLLRRLVRDHKYRHTSALHTLERWDSVRRGEDKWIFPYQENAEAMFNSSLLFEPAVLKPYAEPLLRSVPHDHPQYARAYRLLRLLALFHPLPDDQIPSTSLLREFLGGSSFHY